MQTFEKALHAPMPFTTGGQTISDRLTAAKHSLAGSQLGKTICKATTEELMAPKKKHLDYLLHCTNEPNVSIPSMANLLIERTQHPNWTIVYKALITIHNIMCYGNERFSQYLASCNTTFNLGNFLDKNSTSGYDMSQHVRRYGKYIGEKIATYRVCAFDFCKVKRGREDGLLRTMHTDKLLKTLPILQTQIDALLEFQVSSSELNNGVINCSFILLFRDLIRLFACYNDGIINLLEKYFDMNKKQCRDALDTYKGFLTRLDKVSEFLRVAESVGIDRGEIPDLTRAPASLLEALEAHLIHMEGGRPPAPTQQSQAVQSQVNNFSISGGFQGQPSVAENERQRYIELEKERLRQFEEQKRQQGGAPASGNVSQFNPFAADASSNGTNAPKTNDDLLDLFNAPTQQQQQPAGVDATNPFAQFAAGPAANPGTSMYPQMGGGGMNVASSSTVSYSNQPLQYTQPAMPSYSQPMTSSSNGFSGVDFQRAFSANPQQNGGHQNGIDSSFNTSQPQHKMSGDIDTALSSLADNLNINNGGKAQQSQAVPWGNNSTAGPPSRPPMPQQPMQQQQPQYGAQPPMYGQPQSQYGQPPQQQMQWMQQQQQQPGMYGMQQQPQQMGYGMYGGQQQPQMGYGMQQQMPQQSVQPQQQPNDPFSGF